jgi:hypothetical protein
VAFTVPGGIQAAGSAGSGAPGRVTALMAFMPPAETPPTEIASGSMPKRAALARSQVPAATVSR